jgi:uncharacterized protein
MNIGITGASGFLGRQIIQNALARGHRITPFSRRPGNAIPDCEAARSFGPDIDLNGIEAIFHLAGESILGLWTKKKQNDILRSRIDGTRWIVDAISQAKVKPKVLVSASGAGIYGNRGDESLTESSPASPTGFLAEVASAWETEGSRAEASGVRFVPIRIALVLGKNGGAIPLLKAVFQSGLGGKLGSGKQWMPWIHVADVAGLFLHSLDNEIVRGPVNGVAPNPVRNEEFTHLMGELLKRPTLFAAPAFALRLLPAGEASLVLDSERIIPEKALQTGFQFTFPDLRSALVDVLS